MPANPVTDAEVARFRELHAQGMARNEIARVMNRSPVTVSRLAQRLGLKFDRVATEAATAAKVADARAKRVQLMHDLLDDAQRLRRQLWEPTTIYSFGGKDNTYNSRQVEQPPFRDQRDIVMSVSTALTACLRLDQHDGDGSAEQVGSLLGNLFESLVTKHVDPPADGDG